MTLQCSDSFVAHLLKKPTKMSCFPAGRRKSRLLQAGSSIERWCARMAFVIPSSRPAT